MKLKKMVAASFAGVLALVVTAGPAFADCVNASRPDKANVVIAAHSPTLTNCGFAPCKPFLTFDEALLIMFQAPPGSFYAPEGLGLCLTGAEYLVGLIHDAADQPNSTIDLNWVVGGEALQSGGVGNASNPRALQNLSNGRGIDLFLRNPEIVAVLSDANIATAAGMCQP
jgi:hypothetical protein